MSSQQKEPFDSANFSIEQIGVTVLIVVIAVLGVLMIWYGWNS